MREKYNDRLNPEMNPGGHSRRALIQSFALASTLGLAPSLRAQPIERLRQNPILAGDWPDPTVVRVNGTYYMTHSSFESYPGLLMWKSRDLVRWDPMGCALHDDIGSVWAPELFWYEGLFYLYVPAKKGSRGDIWVLYTKDIEGSWSKPISLGIDAIDPGHAVENGRRFLFVNGGRRVALSRNGLRIDGPLEKVYEGWRYPEEWDVESYSFEGPKLLWRDPYWHMTLALGGTAGPPTGHMVVSARAKTLEGPWEHSPFNPIVRTTSLSDAWWSRGHATLVQGPESDRWYVVYHGYENGFRTLGRQTLLDPIEWTDDGWYRSSKVTNSGLSRERPWHLSLDPFIASALPSHWSFGAYRPSQDSRVEVKEGALFLTGLGRSPSDSPPLVFKTGDHVYQIEVTLDMTEGEQAGIVLFYSPRLYAGLGVSQKGFILHRYGEDRPRGGSSRLSESKIRLRMRNDRHIVTFWFSHDEGLSWEKYGTQLEVSGYHHNVMGGFQSLRPGLYASGAGRVRFSRFVYSGHRT